MDEKFLTLLDLVEDDADGPSIADDASGTPSATALPDSVPNPADDAPDESDVRLKQDVERIGVTNHGLPHYRFRYKGRPGCFTGVMAQDVLKVMPEAVSVGPEGFLRVNYRMLGISITRLN